MSILLDTTLDELYALDSDGPHGIITAYPHPSQSERQTPHPFSSSHFLYGITFPNTTAPNAMQNMLERGIAQRYSFIAGPAPVVLFDSLPSTTTAAAQQTLQSAAIGEIQTLHAQLHPSQRPQLQFPAYAENIHLPRGTRIAIIVPQDELAHLPHIIPAETHYQLLSKRWLALSPLPTLPSTIIDPRLNLPAAATSPDHPAVEQEIQQMLHPLHTHPLPFVLKVSIAASGRGTFIIRTATDRQQAYTQLHTILQTSLPHLTPDNAHLYPLTLLLQPYVAGPAHGVSFFLTQTGRAIFLAASRQQFNAQGQWAGGWVSYPAQPALQQQYERTIAQLAGVLHAEGYYGPVGVDVMGQEEDGGQVIVDVNPRVTGSYHLGLLRGHFVRRGWEEAAVLSPLYVRGDRKGFEERFATAVKEGQLIVTAWVQSEDKKAGGWSYAAVTVGGEDAERLRELVGEVERYVAGGDD
ncbi:putative solid-state culture specific protein [Aspergillus saccharolyticus JOP 1030-1]|uniref:Solid-state culture-specific ATP-grasp domain protein n=1 Tax=Aspergillus saccharolyticus JOP 1030-1 TaxID=1450539 RepID=A0A318ZQ31_9EURO|nr:solid-state culture-specific ATP-grasp domain protein [Aspergillus saccharolyticus JOP 1030-1]PYH48654.1 solid-state culture-specific ATP-grasp domain protein [Aspergillus saccharolyticus JOP 1030-1]